MKSLSTLLLAFFLVSTIHAQLNLDLVSNFTYSQESSDIWGYEHEATGVEYAIVGLQNGTSVVSLADPTSPEQIAYFPGVGSIWRDIKTWSTYAYVVNDDGGGMDIIDFSPLPDNAPVRTTITEVDGLGDLVNCHNIFIDEFGFAYLAGSNLNNGGVVILDVHTDPLNPTLAGVGPARYSHDVYARDNMVYSSDINDGVLSILDVADKGDVKVLAQRSTPADFTHNAWLSDDGNTIYTTDERANAPIASYDISDLGDIRELDQFRPYATLGGGVTPHNVHVWQDWLIISYYTDGCIIVDASRPDNLIEVGNFDSYIPNSTGFLGAWGAYPFLPSGLVLVSDINTGLYVLEPTYVKAAYLEGIVRSALNNNGLAGATIRIVGTDVAAESGFSGVLKTGYAVAGTYDLEISHPTHRSKTIQVELVNGEITDFDVTLEVRQSFTIGGAVTDEETGETLQGATVRMENIDTGEGFETLTNEDGRYTFTNVFEGDYDVIFGKWGYKTDIVSQAVAAADDKALELEPGLQDNFSLALGWRVTGNANNGAFERGKPFQVAAPSGSPVIFPGQDYGDEDIGNSCYATGNTPDLISGLLSNATTILTSPRFDLSTYGEPEMAIATWLFTADGATYQPTGDPLEIAISNGDSTILLESIVFTSTSPLEWTPRVYKLKDYIGLSDDMKVIITATSTGSYLFMEAGVDFFEVNDLNPNPPTSTNNPELVDTKLQAFPNPSTSGFQLNYELPVGTQNAQMVIYNILGQEKARYVLDNMQGQTTFQADNKGIYLAQIQVDGQVSRTIKLMGK